MTNPVVIATGQLQGNLSNCENQEIMINTTDHQLLPWKVTETYAIINKCTNERVSEYERATRGAGFWILIVLSVLILFAIGSVVGD